MIYVAFALGCVFAAIITAIALTMMHVKDVEALSTRVLVEINDEPPGPQVALAINRVYDLRLKLVDAAMRRIGMH